MMRLRHKARGLRKLKGQTRGGLAEGAIYFVMNRCEALQLPSNGLIHGSGATFLGTTGSPVGISLPQSCRPWRIVDIIA